MRPPGPEDVRPCWIYVHMSADEQILYVGKSLEPRYRQRMHAKSSAWWTQVADLDMFGPFTHYDACAVEAALLATHQPPHNIRGTDREAESNKRRGAIRSANARRAASKAVAA